MTEVLYVLPDPIGGQMHDTERVQELLAVIMRLAVDQPQLQHRIGELSSLLSEMLG